MNKSMKKIFINKLSVILFLTCFFTPDFSVEARSSYWHQRVSLFDKLPINENDIVFLGNSITDGGEFAELFDKESVKNRGINSDVISGVRERLDQVTSGKPSKIFLLIGINDVSHNLTPCQIADEYELLVKEIRTKSPSTRLYIQSLMPINNDFGRYKNLRGKENVILKVNELLQEIAKNNDATFIDLWPSLSDENGKLKRNYTNDGLHLLGKGYKAWAAHIKNFVEE